MSTAGIIWLIVAIVVVLILIGIAAALMRRRTQTQHREHAATLRQEADAHAGGTRLGTIVRHAGHVFLQPPNQLFEQR